jgi:hypothetical protein
MTTKPIHILNQMGILTTFSVAKKITEEDVQKFSAKQKKSGKTARQINDMLHEKILNDIQEAIARNEIPGLVSSQELAQAMGLHKDVIDKVPELNRLVMIIAQKLSEKNYDKLSLCYYINALVNTLGLTSKDFDKFHRNRREDAEEDRFRDDADESTDDSDDE